MHKQWNFNHLKPIRKQNIYEWVIKMRCCCNARKNKETAEREGQGDIKRKRESDTQNENGRRERVIERRRKELDLSR